MTDSTPAASPSFAGLHVAAMESRLAAEMSRMIEKFGGVPHVSPSLREVPIEPNRPAIEFAHRLMTGQVDIVILLTGVGLRQLVRAVERHVRREQFLDALRDVTTIARGPKPVAVMRELGLQPTHRVPEPNTWRELLQTVDRDVPVAEQVVALQEYGVSNTSLIAGLEARGAIVQPVRVYAWDLPEDVRPLEANVRALAEQQRDVLLFTSAHQVANLLRVAEQMQLVERLRDALHETVVGSIGPTTTAMLEEHDLPVDVEPDHPKMGHLVQAAAAQASLLRQRKRRSGRLVVTASTAARDQSAPHYRSLLMRACRGEPTERPPIWLMRQAGRYMAEYRAVREKVGFLELCKSPQLCAEVMVTAVDKLGVDAAILFSDLLPILEPMGFHLEFTAGDGPVIHNPLRTADELPRVRELEDLDPLAYVFEGVKATRAMLAPHLPLIGFAGAPFTLASYAIEGGGSRNYAHTKRLMLQDEGAWHELLARLARAVAAYLNAQVAAGAQVVQLFDSWAGCLGPEDYRQYVWPAMQQLLRDIAPGVPVINFATGNPQLLPLLRGDRRTIVGVDWRIPLDEAWQQVGFDRPVQGNLDPTVLLADPDIIRRRAGDVLARARGRSGFIFNLGHGILPQTPVAHVQALVEYVKQAGRDFK
jgi:uroporphyrinogen decarboxylase